MKEGPEEKIGGGDKSADGEFFFSVIVCTYNRSHILGRALQSLRNQHCQDWECLIIDDESTDNTAEEIAPFLDGRVRYIRHAHRGCARSKNAGMEAAGGRYLTFLDSDDEYEPDHLAVRKQFLQQDPAVDLLYSNVKVIGDPFVPDKNDPAKMIAVADCAVGGTFVLRRSALGTADRFRDIYSDDSDFLERFVRKGKVVKKINSPTYIYHRDSPDSMCEGIEGLYFVPS